MIKLIINKEVLWSKMGMRSNHLAETNILAILRAADDIIAEGERSLSKMP